MHHAQDDAGLAWTYVHLAHGLITYYMFHWSKGTPFVEEDQGKYDLLTFWEQVRHWRHDLPLWTPKLAIILFSIYCE